MADDSFGYRFGGIAAFFLIYSPNQISSIYIRSNLLRQFLKYPENNTALINSGGVRCGDAPFMIPSSGMIAYLWDDSFRPGHRHQGIDIFGGEAEGVTPVYASYDGYLTRMPDWISTVIIRIPSDPLNPGTQIWTYYTHMADADGNSFISPEFQTGTTEQYIEAGTLLGYQGNYSGDPDHPVGIHLHFSIVKSERDGSFMNETKITNTMDPSPYLGMQVKNTSEMKAVVPVCP